MRKRATVCLLVLSLIICMLPMAALTGPSAVEAEAAQSLGGYVDIEGHAGARAIVKWSEYGILQGFEGYFRPDEEITRAEMAAIIVRLVGYEMSDGEDYADVSRADWFYSDVMRLRSAGVMGGYAGFMRPYDPITVQEAVAVISRTFEIAGEEADDFKEESGGWAKRHMSAMRDKGYLDDVSLGDWEINITRAEIVMIIDRMFEAFYSEAGVYEGEVGGSAIIRAADITLKNAEIKGDLYIAEGVGDGFYTIGENAVISGEIRIRAGRENPYPYIDTSRPMVAFTFDDGPGTATMGILDALEENGGKATFCVVGYLVADNADKIARAAELGSEIASHTWMHTSITSMSEAALIQDCRDVASAVYEAAGVYPAFVRPPYGNYNGSTSKTLEGLGLATLFWSIDPNDWSHRDANKTYTHIIDKIYDGAIVGLHDSVASTADAMKMLLPELKEMGYQFLTVSEMLAYSPAGIKPGAVYVSRDRLG